MAKSGLKHIDVGPELTKTEWESEESHELLHGTSFPSSPVERQLFYRDDEHKWYIYDGTDWVWLGGGSGGGMEVHGNEYHDPDFEQQGVAAGLVASHEGAADPHTGYIKHSLATAVSDFLVASGAGVFVKKTLAEVKTLLNWAADIATHAGLTTGVHSFNKTCRLWNSAAQSIPNATATDITFNTEKWDTDEMHSLVSNTHLVTCVTPGTYLVAATIEFAANGTGNRQLWIFKNAELQNYDINWSPPATNVCCLTQSCLVSLAVGDTIKLQAYQSSGGALNTASVNPYSPQLAATRIS